MGWLFRGIKEFLAARGPCCVAAEANTRHTQLCHRSGAQVTQNQLLVHTLSRTFKKTFIHTTKWKATPPFHANENLSMGTVIEAGGLQDGTASEYRNKAIPLDVTYADPQAGVHMRTGSSDRDRSAPSTSEAGKHSHYTSPGQGSFDERRCKFATLAVKSCWCLGKEGRNLIGQVTAGNLGDQHPEKGAPEIWVLNTTLAYEESAPVSPLSENLEGAPEVELSARSSDCWWLQLPPE